MGKRKLWNTTVPKWNFHKILINKEGKIQNQVRTTEYAILEDTNLLGIELINFYIGLIFLGNIFLSSLNLDLYAY